MIISPQSVNYLITDKKELDHKFFLKLAKIKGLDVSDLLRKNLSNYFSGKHKQSETTLNIIKNFFKLLVDNKQYSKKIDSVNLLDEIDLSTSKSQYKWIESIYSDFFNGANIENSFLRHEVNKTFEGLYEIITLKENGALDVEIEKELSINKLLPKIDYSDSLFLEIENKTNVFNLDLLLYYFACIDADREERDVSSIQVMFDCLLQDITNGKFQSSFALYISIIKLYNKKNEKITDKEIAELYDMDMRDFYFYKSGKRTLPPKTIALIIEQGHSIYFMALFWSKLIIPFSKNNDSRLKIINKINLYPKLLDIAKAEFCNFKRQKTGHD